MALRADPGGLDCLLRAGLYGVAETAHAAEYRDRRRGGCLSADDRLGGGDGPYHMDAGAALHDHIHVDAAAFLGAGAVCEDRLRQGGHSDDAGGGGGEIHKAPDLCLFGAAAAAHAPAGVPAQERWRAGLDLWRVGGGAFHAVPAAGDPAFRFFGALSLRPVRRAGGGSLGADHRRIFVSEPIDMDASKMEERKRIIAGRNKALGFVLLGLVVLFFAITIAKMGH
ncbi:hypothetical protein E4T56_gene14290 [Termitomyces sp. T112]|nr:hypothetical protein E4T56_gene14290 [Termitomyces sp. T112]